MVDIRPYLGPDDNPLEVCHRVCAVCSVSDRGTAQELSDRGWTWQYPSLLTVVLHCPACRDIQPKQPERPRYRPSQDPSAFLRLRHAAISLVEIARTSDSFGDKERIAAGRLIDALAVSDGLTQSMKVTFRMCYRILGAPGDWGYYSPEGQCLKDLYGCWNECLRLVDAKLAAPAYDPIEMGT